MTTSNDVRLSKFLSLVLRHDPGKIGISLDAQGWVSVDELIAAAARSKVPMTRGDIDRIVAENDKKRFALNEDGTRIRASQGHSVDVDLGLTSVEPPETLFHGTAARNVDAIRREGLLKRSRQHVHLSPDHDTAVKVGQRHGRPVVLVVNSGKMHRDGHPFYRSDNGVWLTDEVPPRYIKRWGL